MMVSPSNSLRFTHQAICDRTSRTHPETSEWRRPEALVIEIYAWVWGVGSKMSTMEKNNSEQLKQSKASFIDFLPKSIEGR